MPPIAAAKVPIGAADEAARTKAKRAKADGAGGRVNAGTVGLPVEQLSEAAAAARKANEAWRFKPRRSQFRGVVWDQKAAHWRVEVRAPGGEMRINCGTWDDELDAGRAVGGESRWS